MKRTVALLLVLCMTIGMMSMTVFGAVEPTLSVVGYNITLKDSIYLKYAVSAENADDVQMLLWNGPRASYELGTQDKLLDASGTETIGGVKCQVFVENGLSMKQMTDVIYARPVTTVNGKTYYGELVKYSVLQYAYNKLGKTGTASANAAFRTLLESMLVFGANAQRYLDYRTDCLADSDFYQVSVEGGVLPDGFTAGLYQSGETVLLTAPETDAEGTAFNHWQTSSGVNAGTSAAMSVTVGTANETYTAVYGEVEVPHPAVSEGLEIEAADGEALVVGIGDCTDDFVVLPDTFEGAPVTGIDASAFAGEEFSGIFIPLSITDIGRRAFNNCGNLTDVYYEGTEEQWNEINIAAGNTALTGADIHFSSYGPAPIAKATVTFKDDTGKVLKTESVAIGESATPPEAPQKDGYIFISWKGNYTNVQKDEGVVAVYEAFSGPVILAADVSAKPGDQVAMKIALRNNPGVAGISMEVNYDMDKLQLDEVEYGAQFKDGGVSLEKLQSPFMLVWSALKNISGDADFAILHFTVKSNVSAGDNAMVKITCNSGEIINIEEAAVDFQVRSGNISIQ